jgi:ABC-2 type transport system permease protein
MSCLYGAYYGLSLVQDIHGNLSARAARINVAPVHKLRLFVAGMLASFAVHMAGLLLFLAYLTWGLGVDFGGKGLAVLAAVATGSVTGLFLGAFVGVAVRGKEATKIAVLSSVTLVGAFLAGMMAPGVKYQISQTLPLLGWLNPANLLADAFYALYYYDNYLRYGVNMGVLALFAFFFYMGSYLIIRRRHYVSL